jgi:hypothetical protein
MGDIYLTGRERTVTWSGSTGGEAYRNWGLYGGTTPLVAQSKVPYAQMVVFGVAITWESNIVTGSGSNYIDIGERVTVALPNNWGSNQQQNIRRFYRPNPYTGNINGTWQVQATLQECVEVTETQPGSGDDAPPYTFLRFFERLKPGSTLSASASCNGVSASASVVVPTGTTYEVTAALVQPLARVGVINEGDTAYTGDCTLSYSSSQTSVGNPNFSQTLTQGGTTRTISVSDSQAYSYASVTGVPPPTAVTAEANAQLWGTKNGTVSLKAFGVDAGYPESLTASVREKKNTWTDVNLSSGSGSLTVSQRRWSILSVLSGNASDYSIDEYETVKAQLKTTSLQAVGEDQYATRLFGHGWLYEAIALGHATRLVLDTCDVLSNAQREWVAVQQCNLSASGGIITITATGSNPIVRRTRLTPSYERWNSYAFLRLRVRASVADAPFTVVVGSKRYNARTGAAANTWADVYIDLCAPSNATASYDQQSTVYPDDRADGDYWGITKASEMRLELAQATWVIDEVSLDVQPWSLRTPPYNVPNHSVHVMPSRGWWMDTGRGYEVRRFITGQSDGKLALELEDVRRTSTTVTTRTIQQLAEQGGASDSNGVAYWPGWTAVLLANTPDPPPSHPADLWSDYLNAYRPATWIAGGGCTYNGSNWASWAGRNQLPGTGTLSIDAQALFDEIDWFPGAGDAWQWGTGAYGGALVLAFGSVLRALAFGLVLDSSRARFASGGVLLQRSSDGQNGGSASLSGWQGYFETGTPYAKGMTEYRLVGTGDAGNVVTSSRIYYTRLPLRTVATLVFSPQFRALHAIDKSHVPIAQANLIADHNLFSLTRIEWREYFPPTHVVTRVRHLPRFGVVLALGKYDASYSLRMCELGSDRQTEVISLTATSAMIEIAEDQRTALLVYSLSDGSVYRRLSRDGGWTWGTAQQCTVAGGGNLTAQALTDLDYSPRRRCWFLIAQAGSTTFKVYASEDGLTWHDTGL